MTAPESTATIAVASKRQSFLHHHNDLIAKQMRGASASVCKYAKNTLDNINLVCY